MDSTREQGTRTEPRSRPSPRRDAEHAQTRARFLDAFAALATTRPYHEISVSDVAAMAKASVGLIYRHFETKEEIAVGLLVERLHELRDRLSRHACDHASRVLGTLTDWAHEQRTVLLVAAMNSTRIASAAREPRADGDEDARSRRVSPSPYLSLGGAIGAVMDAIAKTGVERDDAAILWATAVGAVIVGSMTPSRFPRVATRAERTLEIDAPTELECAEA